MRPSRVPVLVVAVALGLVYAMGSSAGASRSTKLTKPEQTLISKHVPSALASTCVGSTSKIKKTYSGISQAKPYVKAVVAAVNCSPTGPGAPTSVSYQQFANLKDMNQIYAVTLAAHSIQSDTRNPNGDICPQEGSNGTVTIGSSGGTKVTTIGRVGCAPSTTSPQQGGTLLWTNDHLKILSVATADNDPDGSLLLAFFHGKDPGPEG